MALFALLATMAPPAMPELTVSIGSIENPAFQIAQVRLQVEDSKAVLTAERLETAGRRYGRLRAECGRFSWQMDGFSCENALLTAEGIKDRLPFSLTQRNGVLEIALQPGKGEQWRIRRQPDQSIEFSVDNGRLENLQAFLPLPPEWKINGKVDGRFRLTQSGISGQATLREGGFADKAGEHAAEKLALDLRVNAKRSGSAWSWETELKWTGGEAYWQPFYAKAHGQVLSARGRFDERKIAIAEARLQSPGVGEISGAIEWDRKAEKILSARLDSPGLDLARGGEVYLNPLLMPFGVPEMTYGGRLSFSLIWDKEGLETLGVGLNEVSLREVRGRFSATGIHGGIPWQREGKVQGNVLVAGLQAGAFKFGAFELPLLVEPRRFAIDKTEIPFLDSKLVIERLAWRKSNKRQAWEGDLSMSILPVQLADLTTAFGLPRMTGTLSGSFPRLRYRDKAAYLDGALVIQVFEGYLNCTQLRLEEPFGTVSRLTADIEAQRINLGQLTETFSFGGITGYADAEIKELELAAWKPVKFDARIVSSEGDYRKRISQRAVQNISSLGGNGAGAALQATFLRFFEEFGYDKIGISCKMRGGICEMGGVENAPNGYVLIKGGGLPALTVMGYNRHVNWTELVDRIKGAININSSPVVK